MSGRRFIKPKAGKLQAKPTSEIWVPPSSEHLAPICRDFISLDSVATFIYANFDVLIDMKNHSTKLVKLLESADLWVTSRLSEIEGRPRAVVSRDRFTSEDEVIAWINSIIGPLGNSYARGARMERVVYEALKPARAHGYRVRLTPKEDVPGNGKRRYGKTHDLTMIYYGEGRDDVEQNNIEVRLRRGLLTGRLVSGEIKKLEEDASAKRRTVFVPTASTPGFLHAAKAINENTIVIETGIYVIPDGGDVEAVQAITPRKVMTEEEALLPIRQRLQDAFQIDLTGTEVSEADTVEIAKFEPTSRERLDIVRYVEMARELRPISHENRQSENLAKVRVAEGDRLCAARLNRSQVADVIRGRYSMKTLERAYRALGRVSPWSGDWGGMREGSGRRKSSRAA